MEGNDNKYVCVLWMNYYIDIMGCSNTMVVTVEFVDFYLFRMQDAIKL